MITNDVDEALLLADRIIPLRPGPNASLGKEFIVDLPRPRDRRAVNDNVAFKSLRAEITQYLIDVGFERSTTNESKRYLPNVSPITADADDVLPVAYSEAAKSPIPHGYVEYFRTKKIYPTATGPLTVVDNFDLKVNRGEFISLIGHSGCGKSTVLSMTAGLSEISDGGIVLSGREIDGAGPDRAVVF